ncbi:hypothetical protein BBSC_2242 [Bifidobacterium scardovii JCM 12489 = DSM 13734]|nr:hypothetical protein BBSC_2242 [Bifidobacterium scardovii JCM 12489 = DSM 13734]
MCLRGAGLVLPRAGRPRRRCGKLALTADHSGERPPRRNLAYFFRILSFEFATLRF